MKADHAPCAAAAPARPELVYEYDPPPPGAQQPRDPLGPELVPQPRTRLLFALAPARPRVPAARRLGCRRPRRTS